MQMERLLAQQKQLQETRREFLVRSAQGIGLVALSSLLRGNASPADLRPEDKWTGIINPPHYLQRAKRIIYLYMAGGPSHLETFDSKPKLAEMHGEPMPQSVTKGAQMSTMTSGQRLVIMKNLYPFQRFGDSGQEICSLFPSIGGLADDIHIIRSMQTEQINHDPAHTFMNTGTTIQGRPSLGSWVFYGLGSDSNDLPGFVVMTSLGGGGQQPIAARQWHSGFLPGRFQGIQFQSKGSPVNYVSSPPGVSFEDQRDLVATVNRLNQRKLESVDDPEIATRIAQYEMAFRMQASVPDLVDLSDEPEHIKKMYGVERLDGSFAANCLLARRLAERGVRFIQLYHRGWDHHSEIHKNMPKIAGFVDQASAALVKDLKQRGMLEDTLVVWGGEFGRTPMAQPSKKEGGEGRDHHINCFSIWLAGGGIRGGGSYGKTDDFGFNVAQDPVHVHDLHATVLHLLGVDHKELTYRYQGRDFRLTDVGGKVVHPILA